MKLILTTTALIVLSVMTQANANDIKKADLAGKWYPRSASQLSAELSAYEKDARLPEISGRIIGLICPHAGSPASGPVAAYAFKALKLRKPATVIIVGFTHRKNFPATAIFGGDGFETPLGVLEIDKALSGRIADRAEDIVRLDEAFDEENSVEMLIPFLQHALGKDVRAVLLAIGNQSEKTWKNLADALAGALEDEENAVMVASTDLSHYLPYTTAFKTDRLTQKLMAGMSADRIFGESLENGHSLMCGVSAVCAVTEACARLGADGFVLLDQRNSGDTLGDKSAVVGYLSAALVKGGGVKTEPRNEKETASGRKPDKDTGHETTPPDPDGGGLLDAKQQETLLGLARRTIECAVSGKKLTEPEIDDPLLNEPLGLFVTLHKRGELRGCIGNMVGTRPLWRGVMEMAVAAATQDPRFPKVRAGEMKDIDLEISVLSPLEKTDDPSKIVMGRHGVLVSSGYTSGVYLPQVATETGWTREQFMNSLCGQKAGMRADAWKTGGCEIYTFTASVFGEKDRR